MYVYVKVNHPSEAITLLRDYNFRPYMCTDLMEESLRMMVEDAFDEKELEYDEEKVGFIVDDILCNIEYQVDIKEEIKRHVEEYEEEMNQNPFED